MKRRGAVLLFAVVAAVGLYMVPAGATGRHHHDDVLVVDNQPHHRRSCLGTRDPFDTIQGAVNAADSGDTIRVCPGTYKETVKVQKPGPDHPRRQRRPRRHRRPPGSRVDRDQHRRQGDRAAARGRHHLGRVHDPRRPQRPRTAPACTPAPPTPGTWSATRSSWTTASASTWARDGKHPTLVCRNRFTANNEFEGPGGANGIYSDEGAQQVLITSNLFEGHNGAAVFFADKGKLQRDVLIEHNKSVDDLSFASIFNSTRVRVTSNWIKARVGDEQFPGPASAIFIGARNDDIVVQKNKIKSASGNGIDITNTGAGGVGIAPPTNVVVRKNKVEHAQLSGIAVSATGVGEYQVLANRSLTNTKFGIHFAAGTKGGTVTGNTALGNEMVDCKDRVRPPEHLDRERRPDRRAPGPLQRPHRRQPRPRRQGPSQEAQEEAPQEDQEAQAAPPGPVPVHPPLALLT